MNNNLLNIYVNFEDVETALKFVIIELTDFIFTNYKSVVHYQKELSIFGITLQRSEMLIHDEKSDILRVVSLADHSDMVANLLIKRNNPNDIAVISQHTNLNDIPKCKVKKGIYFPLESHDYSFIYQKRKSFSEQIDKFYFVGNPINHVDRVSTINELKDSKYFYGGFEKISVPDYYEDIIKYKVGLSIKGIGDLCHRDFEYFGMGVPLMRKEFKNELNPPLIPNVHYIAVDENISYVERFLEVKDDEKFLNFISNNAKNYFDSYIAHPKRINHIIRLLDIY